MNASPLIPATGTSSDLHPNSKFESTDLTPAQANKLLQNGAGELSEVLIEFAGSAPRQLVINGMDAGFNGSGARIFTDRAFNEIYADDGISYELCNSSPGRFPPRKRNSLLPKAPSSPRW